jgi:hypothetical protein
MADDESLVHDLPAAIDQALVDGGFKGEFGAPALNTVLHRLSVLSKAHQMRDVPNPTRDPPYACTLPNSLATLERPS